MFIHPRLYVQKWREMELYSAYPIGLGHISPMDPKFNLQTHTLGLYMKLNRNVNYLSNIPQIDTTIWLFFGLIDGFYPLQACQKGETVSHYDSRRRGEKKPTLEFNFYRCKSKSVSLDFDFLFLTEPWCTMYLVDSSMLIRG